MGPRLLTLISHVAPLAVGAALGLTACDSANAPTAPSGIDQNASIAAAPAWEGPAAATLEKAPPPASTIFIDRGEADMVDQGGVVRGPVALYENHRFSMTADVGGPLHTTPLGYCNQQPACAPGAEVPLFVYRVGMDFPATVTLDGTTYRATGSATAEAWADVEFNSRVIMPPLNKHGADHVTAPFTFKGHFSSQTSSIVRVGLTGRGVVTAWLTRADFEGFPPTWRIDRLVYKFKHCGATPCPSLEP